MSIHQEEWKVSIIDYAYMFYKTAAMSSDTLDYDITNQVTDSIQKYHPIIGSSFETKTHLSQFNNLYKYRPRRIFGYAWVT